MDSNYGFPVFWKTRWIFSPSALFVEGFSRKNVLLFGVLFAKLSNWFLLVLHMDEVGIMVYPLKFMQPKIPGLGDVKWDKFVSALTDIGYDGAACIEVADRSFEGREGKVRDSLALGKRYMEQFVI